MTTIKITRARNQKYINKVICLDLENKSTTLLNIDYSIGFGVNSIDKLKRTNSIQLSKANVKGYSVVWIDEFEILN